MRVGLVTPRYPPISSGGGERSAKLLADSLQNTPDIDSVDVFSFDGRADSKVDGVPVHRLGTPSSTLTEYLNVVAYRRLRSRLKGFDVVHAYNMELHPVVGYLSDREGFPSVATLNSYHFFSASVANLEPGPVERFYELVAHPTTGRLMRHYMKRIDVLIALSNSIRDIYQKKGFDECRIEHVTNMADPSFEALDVSENHEGCRLLYVGTLTANKGVEYLIRAINELSPEYSLRVVGDGDRAPELQRLADNLGVGERVEFTGRVPYEQLPELYATSDMFVHPGVWPEPLNRTVLEAMQAGLPVVCTDVGGPPEIIPSQELLCRPADPVSIAEAIERARDSESIGEENRRYVREHHHPDVVIPRIIALYNDLID